MLTAGPVNDSCTIKVAEKDLKAYQLYLQIEISNASICVHLSFVYTMDAGMTVITDSIERSSVYMRFVLC